MKLTSSSLYLIVLALITIGGGLTVYRHVVVGVPWIPGEQRTVWSVEAKVEFIAQGEPVKVSLAIPDSQRGLTRMSEHTASPGYGLAFTEHGQARRAEWSIRQAWGGQTLYYTIDMQVDSDESGVSLPPPPIDKVLGDQGPYTTSALGMLASAVARSSDAFTLTRELIKEFNIQDQSASFLAQQQSRIDWLVELLNEADVAAREVKILRLEDGRRRQKLLPYLQVFDEQGRYALYDPESAREGLPNNRMMWEYHSGSLLDIVGGSDSRVSFSVIEQNLPALQIIADRRDEHAEGLLGFSIHSLPLEERALFKNILLVPVGVMMVVFMRIFIGLRTSGTFMPVLIAIAFMQTSLGVGVIGFFLLVGVGLLIRSYLSYLNLLLVSRISAVIISVIMIIAVFSVVFYQMGLTEGLKITFFPMIILSWTIERMSILWEEEGPKEVIVQVGGSLLIALLAYAAMTNEVVRHLTFNFLGLQFVFMAAVLLMGNYKGYRLLELYRFVPLLGGRSGDQ